MKIIEKIKAFLNIQTTPETMFLGHIQVDVHRTNLVNLRVFDADNHYQGEMLVYISGEKESRCLRFIDPVTNTLKVLVSPKENGFRSLLLQLVDAKQKDAYLTWGRLGLYRAEPFRFDESLLAGGIEILLMSDSLMVKEEDRNTWTERL